MKTDVWIVTVIVAVFIGYLMGYTVPPMVEVGLIGGGGESGEVGLKSKVDESMEEYYRSLSAEGK